MKTMTRTEYEKLPKVPGGLWLTDMQTMADELADYYDSVDAGTAPEPDVDEVMKELIQKATESMSRMKEWSDLSFLSYTYWSCMEEMEKWNALAYTAGEERFEGMLRTHIITAWLLALKIVSGSSVGRLWRSKIRNTSIENFKRRPGGGELTSLPGLFFYSRG